MVGESNQNVFLIQIDASSFTEFEISEFEISRFDCSLERSWPEEAESVIDKQFTALALALYGHLQSVLSLTECSPLNV